MMFQNNNICWNSLGGFFPQSISHLSTISDYNCYTNQYTGNAPTSPASATTAEPCPRFQLLSPTTEQHSGCRPRHLCEPRPHPPRQRERRLPSREWLASIGRGANLSATFNTNVFPFAALPSAYRVDPTSKTAWESNAHRPAPGTSAPTHLPPVHHPLHHPKTSAPASTHNK